MGWVKLSNDCYLNRGNEIDCVVGLRRDRSEGYVICGANYFADSVIDRNGSIGSLAHEYIQRVYGSLKRFREIHRDIKIYQNILYTSIFNEESIGSTLLCSCYTSNFVEAKEELINFMFSNHGYKEEDSCGEN